MQLTRGKVISAIVSMILGMLALTFVLIPAINETLKTTPEGSAEYGILSVLPVVAVVFIIVSVFRALGTDSEEEQQLVDGQPYWVRYGERLKLAYAAKFGGPNKAFSEEVDSHVSMMVNLSRGWTRQLAKNWMKRMKDFTEARI